MVWRVVVDDEDLEEVFGRLMQVLVETMKTVYMRSKWRTKAVYDPSRRCPGCA